MKLYSTLTPEQEAAWWDAAERGNLEAFLQRRGNLDTTVTLKAAIAEGKGVEPGDRPKRSRVWFKDSPAPRPTADYEGRDAYKKHLDELFS